MKIYRGFHDKALRPKRRAVAIGVFDGVHRAHQMILSRMLLDARLNGISSMVITFDPNPAKVLGPKKPQPAIIMSLEHRLQFFERLGIQEAIVVPFTRAFSRIGRDVFFEKLLVRAVGMQSLMVGHDFCFGYKAQGNAEYLRSRCQERKIRFFLVNAIKFRGDVISSTNIRIDIEKGKLISAGRMLGRPVSVCGTVVRGRGRGRTIGFPTANLNPHHEALPPAGVYAVYGYLGKRKLRGVLHIGERPTFKDEKSIEVHFLGFSGNIYGRQIELVFVKKLREIKRFSNVNLLKKAIDADIRRARKSIFVDEEK